MNNKYSIKKVLMSRDNMTSEEADELIADFKKEFDEVVYSGGGYEEAVYLIEEWFGLEPDYLEELIF